MRKLIVTAIMFLGIMVAFCQDVSYNLNLSFDNGVNAVLKVEDVGNKSFVTLITDDVAKMEVLSWDKKEQMIIYYLGEITIYINAANNRFTISYGKTNLNGDWIIY